MVLRVIDDELSLVPYYPDYETALPWYQDRQLCLQIDNKDHVYSLDLLKSMYEYLCERGNCFYVQYQGRLVGDATLLDDGELAIVICKEYQNRHLGRKCISSLIELAGEKGMKEVYANIYSFNKQSSRMFTSLGFRQVEEEKYLFPLTEEIADPAVLR